MVIVMGYTLLSCTLIFLGGGGGSLVRADLFVPEPSQHPKRVLLPCYYHVQVRLLSFYKLCFDEKGDPSCSNSHTWCGNSSGTASH